MLDWKLAIHLFSFKALWNDYEKNKFSNTIAVSPSHRCFLQFQGPCMYSDVPIPQVPTQTGWNMVPHCPTIWSISCPAIIDLFALCQHCQGYVRYIAQHMPAAYTVSFFEMRGRCMFNGLLGINLVLTQFLFWDYGDDNPSHFGFSKCNVLGETIQLCEFCYFMDRKTGKK